MGGIRGASYVRTSHPHTVVFMICPRGIYMSMFGISRKHVRVSYRNRQIQVHHGSDYLSSSGVGNPVIERNSSGTHPTCTRRWVTGCASHVTLAFPAKFLFVLTQTYLIQSIKSKSFCGFFLYHSLSKNIFLRMK